MKLLFDVGNSDINLQNSGQDADDLVDSAGYDGRNFDDKLKVK